MMRKGFPLRAIIFLIAFLLFVSHVDIPGLSAGDIPGDETDSEPLIDEAIEHITFYSTFHYQTVDEDELS